MEEIDTKELLILRNKNPNLVTLDCRGPDYWRWEHIPSSINLRWKYITDQALDLIPDLNTQIVTYCDGITCTASTKAYKKLKELGYRSLLEYSGGISEWKAYGNKTNNDPKYKLAENVYLFPNQTFYASMVNTYLIEEDEKIILIDGPQQLTEENEDFILSFGKPIDLILTHAATGYSSKLLKEKLNACVWIHEGDKSDKWLFSQPDKWLKGNETFSPNIKVIHTPGHSDGSVSIIDSKNRMIFTGDHLAGDGSDTIFDIRKDTHSRGTLKERLNSLELLLGFNFNSIHPFHYHQIHTSGYEKLSEFLKGVKNEKN